MEKIKEIKEFKQKYIKPQDEFQFDEVPWFGWVLQLDPNISIQWWRYRGKVATAPTELLRDWDYIYNTTASSMQVYNLADNTWN